MQYPTIAQPQYGFAPTMPMMPSMSDMPPAMMADGGLVAAAKDVQSKGRGNDTMLVHMTPKEVGGLQALAMQHGGSLTINPQTGLPEAGFLDNLLPTLLGFGLNFMFPGSGALIGLGVGGIETLRTGDLGKGILAGLGAYGGANLGASLGAAGAAGTTAAGTAGATAAGAGGTAGLEFANAASPEFLASQGVGTASTAAGAAGAGAPSAFGTTINPVTFGDTGAAIYGGTASPAMQAANLGIDEMAVNAVTGGDAVRFGSQAAPSFSSNAAQAGQGFQNIFASGDTGTQAREAFLKSSGGYSGLATDVGTAAAPMLLAQPEYSMPTSKDGDSNYEGPYTPTERTVSYPDDERRRRSSEFTFFTPSNPVPFAEGGKIEEDRSIKMPGADYVAGRMPEFSHGFKPVGIEGRNEFGMTPDQMNAYTMGEALSRMGGEGGPPGVIGGLFNIMGQKMKDSASEYTDLSGYEYDPRTQRLIKPSNAGGLPALARGGSVPQLENGGFVLTKKAVDGLGKGNNKKGQKVASRGLGAIPIKGPGTGTSDSIKTSIDGKRPALVSNGEAYVPKKQVTKHGGAKKFYALMKKAERRA